MSLRTFNTSWDSRDDSSAEFDDLDLEKIAKFIEQVNGQGRFRLDTSPTILKKLRMVRKGKPHLRLYASVCKVAARVSYPHRPVPHP